MVIYEVNLAVDDDRVNEHSAWLEEHIREMLQLDGFDSAALYVRSGTDDVAPATSSSDGGEGDRTGGDTGEEATPPERVPEGQRHWTVHYHLTDRDALDRYLDEDAEAMRKKSADQFGDDFAAERRVLESRKVFSHQER